MAYNITFKKSVSKDLKKIAVSEANRILNKLNSELSVKADQYPELQGAFAGLRKYRVGNYRVIYAIINDSVLVVRIQHRKDVYRK
ncbi:MAG: type II toxin-antitoxin system RelE/ParE family toxin [Victivallales bacterium]|nr:type II toxin-antitoxin system RelE/ParE family toxin [Victivallales bacterium]